MVHNYVFNLILLGFFPDRGDVLAEFFDAYGFDGHVDVCYDV